MLPRPTDKPARELHHNSARYLGMLYFGASDHGKRRSVANRSWTASRSRTRCDEEPSTITSAASVMEEGKGGGGGGDGKECR